MIRVRYGDKFKETGVISRQLIKIPNNKIKFQVLSIGVVTFYLTFKDNSVRKFNFFFKLKFYFIFFNSGKRSCY